MKITLENIQKAINSKSILFFNTVMKATQVSAYQPNTIVVGTKSLRREAVIISSVEDHDEYFYVGYTCQYDGVWGYTRLYKDMTTQDYGVLEVLDPDDVPANANRLLKEYKGQFAPFFKVEATKQAQKFNETTVTDGIPRWNTNGRIPPKDLLELWYYCGRVFDYQATIKTSDEETAQSIEEYKQSRAQNGYAPEELAEMKAEFGDTPVVDVLTGKRVQ